jgi:hypothetical protein
MTRRLLFYLFASLVMKMPMLATASQIVIGPPDPSAEHGFDYWYHGTGETGFLFIDNTDPASGNNDFTLGNTNASKGNLSDWRSKNFALGPAAKGVEPITFLFTYELPDNVSDGDNIRVELRFFDATGTNFLSEKKILVGSDSGDSKMTSYKRIVITNIRAPKMAQMADIRFNANLFEPWASGIGRFDDFSVTTVQKGSLTVFVVVTGIIALLIFIGIGTAWWLSKSRNG